MVYVYGAASVAASSSACNKHKPAYQPQAFGGDHAGGNKQAIGANNLKVSEPRAAKGFLNSTGKAATQIGYKYFMKVLK